jgi:hypothetical protein
MMKTKRPANQRIPRQHLSAFYVLSFALFVPSWSISSLRMMKMRMALSG